VDTVPTNTGSYDETVLSAPPWTTVTTKTAVGARFGQASCTGAGNTTFTANGLPTGPACQAENRTHENHHAADHQVQFNATIKPWDDKVTAAKAANSKFPGATPAAADAACWAAMGGTPNAIADAWFNGCVAVGAAFHATPAGRSKAVSNPQADATCATSSIDVT